MGGRIYRCGLASWRRWLSIALLGLATTVLSPFVFATWSGLHRGSSSIVMPSASLESIPPLWIQVITQPGLEIGGVNLKGLGVTESWYFLTLDGAIYRKHFTGSWLRRPLNIVSADEIEAIRAGKWTEPHHVEIAIGWPMPCFVGAWFGSTGVPAPTRRYLDTVALPNWLAALTRGGHRRVLPMRPIWSNLGVNALFFALLWSAILWPPFLLRAKARNVRGLCPKCAYDLRGNLEQGCPECGWRRETAS